MNGEYKSERFRGILLDDCSTNLRGYIRVDQHMGQILLTLSILCASVQLVVAYNDAIAIAVPVEGIQIDGDLSDWPKDLPMYRIRMNTNAYGPTDLTGTRLDSSADFSPHFRVGYSVQEQLVYVALEVRDDSLTDGDGCEILVRTTGFGYTRYRRSTDRRKAVV